MLHLTNPLQNIHTHYTYEKGKEISSKDEQEVSSTIDMPTKERGILKTKINDFPKEKNSEYMK